MAAGLLSFGIHWGTILCSVSMPGITTGHQSLCRKGLFFFFFFGLSGDLLVWVAMSHQLPQIVLRAFKPGPYPKEGRCSLGLPIQSPLNGGGCEHLSHFSTDSYCQVHILCVCFFLMLPSVILKLPTDTPVRGFPIVWKLLLHDSLPRTDLRP